MVGRSSPFSQVSIFAGFVWMRRAASSVDNPAAERNHSRTARSTSAFGDCAMSLPNFHPNPSISLRK